MHDEKEKNLDTLASDNLKEGKKDFAGYLSNSIPMRFWLLLALVMIWVYRLFLANK